MIGFYQELKEIFHFNHNFLKKTADIKALQSTVSKKSLPLKTSQRTT